VTDSSAHPEGLRIEDLCVHYGAVDALADVSCTVRRGEHVILVGPSGSGKSTLLRCIAGLLMPGRGTMHWNGACWTDAAQGTLIPPERRGIGLMTQHPALWPHLSARQHLLLTLKWKGVKRSRRAEEADRLLDLVALTPRAAHRPSELSGGEAQRLALARALCGNPALLLLDEPLGQLDLMLRESVAGDIRRAADIAGTTVVHVTHDPHGIVRTDDRIGVLDHGRLVQFAPAGELAANPGTAFAAAVARAVNGARDGGRDRG